MQLEKRISQIAILNDLSPEDIRQICRVSVEKKFNETDIIIKEGDFADAFYFILEGSVKVYKKSKSGQISTLATLEEDACFGEQGFQNFSIRTSSVKAITPLRVLEISYETLDIILKKSNKSSAMLEKQSLGKSIANLQTQLASIDAYVKRELFTRSDKSTLRHYKKDEIIFNIGDKPDYVYFVASGSVILNFNPHEDSSKTLTISENHLFGEVGVIRNIPRAATAIAKTTVSVITIPKEDFINAYNQNIGLKKLINSFERVYSLPHHEIIKEQFVSHLENEAAIFTKYFLPNNKIATCAMSIDHPIFMINIRDVVPNATFQYTASANKLEISMHDDLMVGIKAVGHWPRLNELCEILLMQHTVPHADEGTFARFLE